VSTPLTDSSVKFYHTFNNMSFYEFPLPNGTVVQTCPAALGYGFAGGTTDGPGAFDFTQNDNTSKAQNPFWELVSDVLSVPTPEQVACQVPKPILLNVGQMTFPYAWSPNIVDIQSLRVGSFIIIISPSEATTMTGRRWRDAVATAAVNQSITTTTPKVVLGGPANTYAHYCATREEYSIQRYEGASTLYGQWESDAYIHLSTSNIGYLAAGSTEQPPAGPTPPDNRAASESLSIINKDVVVYDNAPIGSSFGECTTQPNASYHVGDTINATFVGANPRNNLRLEGTFTAIEQQLANGTWVQVRSDKDWGLVYTWTRTNTVLGYSSVVVEWETESHTTPGTYRTVYYGDHKIPVLESIQSFVGYSNSYTIS
jgi:neutral ceramidase